MSVGSACSSAGSGVGALRSNSRLLRRRSRDMALSVADVYDLAADIGKVSLLLFQYVNNIELIVVKLLLVVLVIIIY